MSSTGPNRQSCSQSALLRWCEQSGFPSQEQIVEVTQALPSQAIILSLSNIKVGTEVHLAGRNYEATGIVRSCVAQGSSFIITVLITHDRSRVGSDLLLFDPGLFVVDSFLSDEAETRILDEFENEAPRGRPSYRFKLKVILSSLLKLPSLYLSASL